MKVSLHTIGSLCRNQSESVEAGFRLIREAGFDAVDFNFELFSDYDSLAATDGSCFYDKSESELQDFFEDYKEACASQGLEFAQCHSPFLDYISYMKKDAAYGHFLEVTRKCIGLAGFMGIPFLVVHPLCTERITGKEREWDINIGYFSELIDCAAKAGVVVCIENIFTSDGQKNVIEGACSDAAECVSYIDALNKMAGEERFGLCFDFGHAALLKKDIRDFIETAGNRLKVLHLHDNDGCHDLHGLPYSFPKYWAGPPIADWDGLIMGLRAIDYKGIINFEAGPALYTVPEELAGSLRRYICEIGRYIADRVENSIQRRT